MHPNPTARLWRTLSLSLAALMWSQAPMAQPVATPAPALAAVALEDSVPHTVVNASFPCQQTTCEAELWLPKQAAGAPKPPVIIMAHGFGALKDWGLKPYAATFVKAGFAVVRFDYRGFGKSGGKPRHVVDGKAHILDWLAAIDNISQRADVDGQRLGLWGTSYSGGQVMVAAAERPALVKAVSMQVPFVSGLSSGLRYPFKYLPQAAWYGLRDLMRSDDQEPIYVPATAENAFSVLVCDECAEGYNMVVPASEQGHADVAARVLLTLPFFEPGRRAADVQAPALLIAAEKDGLIPVEKVREVAARLPHGEYVELKGANHFSPYTGALFGQVSSRQTAFFVKNLSH